MDPISIAGLVAGVIPIACQVATGITGFAREAYDNTETLNKFASEVESLTRMLEAATATLRNVQFPGGPGGGPSAEVCRVLYGSVDDIRLYLERLRLCVQRIQGDTANRNLYRRTIRTFAAPVNRTGVNDLRSLLRTHHLSLNTALAMINLHHATHRAGHQQTDLRPGIDCLTQTVERLATAADIQRLRDDLTAHHIRDLQVVAQSVVDNASQTAASTAGSEIGGPPDPQQRQMVTEWLHHNVSERSYTPDLNSWSLQETSISHMQLSPIQGGSLQQSLLSTGGHQTQPASSNNWEEATTGTRTTRRPQISDIDLPTLPSPPRKRQKGVGNSLLLLSMTSFIVFLLAVFCAVRGGISRNRRIFAVPTLLVGVIASIWSVFRFMRTSRSIGHRGFLMEVALG